jgi:hypothetical protein
MSACAYLEGLLLELVHATEVFDTRYDLHLQRLVGSHTCIYICVCECVCVSVCVCE